LPNRCRNPHRFSHPQRHIKDQRQQTIGYPEKQKKQFLIIKGTIKIDCPITIKPEEIEANPF
jgi:hypothetical protein